MTRKVFLRWIKIIIIVYCAIGIAIYYLQDQLILVPTSLPKSYRYAFDVPFRELNIPYSPGSNLNLIQFLAEDSARPKGIVLYFHGNKTNISRYQRFVPWFTKAGFETWMIDYPGYGKSTGTFSEELVYEWSLLVYNLARKRFQPDSIIIYGKSLGTGVASQLASIRNCRYLMLESPYYSIPAVFASYVPIYPLNRMIRHEFPNHTFLPKVTDPVIIFHGTSDGVIPYSHSKRLQKLLKKTDLLVTVEDGSHNDLFDFPQVTQTIDSLLKRK